jgi:hypothetical protein
LWHGQPIAAGRASGSIGAAKLNNLVHDCTLAKFLIKQATAPHRGPNHSSRRVPSIPLGSCHFSKVGRYSNIATRPTVVCGWKLNSVSVWSSSIVQARVPSRFAEGEGITEMTEPKEGEIVFVKFGDKLHKPIKRAKKSAACSGRLSFPS